MDWIDLISRVASHGDRDAFARLFEHFAPRVKGFLIKTGSDPETAEDIAQSTFVAVWRKAGQFDPTTAGVAAWIFTIARNQRIDIARRALRHDRALQSPETAYEVETVASPEAIRAQSEDVTRIAKALARLSEEQSTVVRLSFIEERPHGEIASSLGIPLGTVKSRIRLAMKRLRELLDEQK
ncbi:sigma-70 family RNA polymerase sigma factor [Bradyrhizobium guangzhouense]|uniref:RNA polymerase sigma factor n=1 Tax=Bradyrhizobium guangzhouense TaxID=1325095 RepID=A0AAE5WWJ0_9BRAD|nr:sigma-70 family RNA polymerase sigma factor [Bradyrhizobium guangzhouense]QAU44413.1 RNA polymerase subunit sigma [Bradyrhizobium guangzhouense]RXH09283.1 sigma-70 family RNA polymerase sigma factor [Bradyrhizobium guangzhouense]RXH10017.1 sigma-70 family RNA polymerase sigma factor [Bradyrhizobium guangzhouense]